TRRVWQSSASTAAPRCTGAPSTPSALAMRAGAATTTSIAVTTVATSTKLDVCSASRHGTRRFLASTARCLPIYHLRQQVSAPDCVDYPAILAALIGENY